MRIRLRGWGHPGVYVGTAGSLQRGALGRSRPPGTLTGVEPRHARRLPGRLCVLASRRYADLRWVHDAAWRKATIAGSSVADLGGGLVHAMQARLSLTSRVVSPIGLGSRVLDRGQRRDSVVRRQTPYRSLMCALSAGGMLDPCHGFSKGRCGRVPNPPTPSDLGPRRTQGSVRHSLGRGDRPGPASRKHSRLRALGSARKLRRGWVIA